MFVLFRKEGDGRKHFDTHIVGIFENFPVSEMPETQRNIRLDRKIHIWPVYDGFQGQADISHKLLYVQHANMVEIDSGSEHQSSRQREIEENPDAAAGISIKLAAIFLEKAGIDNARFDADSSVDYLFELKVV